MRFRPFWSSTSTDRSDCGDRTGVADQATSESATEFGARLDGLVAEVARLGREQFRATTLIDGYRAQLEEISDVLQEHVGRQQAELAESRLAQAGQAFETRVQLLTELLPVADGLHASIGAGRDLLGSLRQAVPERTQSSARYAGWTLRRLLGAHEPRPSAADHGQAVEAWLDGLLLLERRLLAVFARHALRPIPAIGEPFNPHFHLAVGTRVEHAAADGTIVAEELTGYAVGERVLRHAQVVVARSSTPHDDDVDKEAS
jgi:molecular chaperone GrpE (heat shock protein)